MPIAWTDIRHNGAPLAAAVTAMASVQSGAAIAVILFDRVTPPGTAWLRLSFGALLLLLWTRPRVKRLRGTEYALVTSLGATSATMTLCSFEAISRLPLGTVSAIEFLGPLTISVAGTRRCREIIWSLLGLSGVLLLTHPWTSTADITGVIFGLGAAAGLSGYIILTQRAADKFQGQQGIALSTTAAAIFTGLFAAGRADIDWFTPPVLAISLSSAVLLPVIPHVLESWALRRLTSSSYGTLMSLEPAMGTMVGLVVLAQVPAMWQILGIALVCAAGAGACRHGRRTGAHLSESGPGRGETAR